MKIEIKEEPGLDKIKRLLKVDEVIVRMKDTKEDVIMPKTQYELIKEEQLGIRFIFIYKK